MRGAVASSTRRHSLRELGHRWSLRGRYREGAAWCNRSVAAAVTPPASGRASCAVGAEINASFYGGEVVAALALASPLAVDAATAGEPTLEARALGVLGLAVGYADMAMGIEQMDRAIERAMVGGDEFTITDLHEARGFLRAVRAEWGAAAADSTPPPARSSTRLATATCWAGTPAGERGSQR